MDRWVRVLCDLQFLLMISSWVRESEEDQVQHRRSFQPYTRFSEYGRLNIVYGNGNKMKLYISRQERLDSSTWILLSPFSFLKIFEAVMEAIVKMLTGPIRPTGNAVL